jgi:aspartate--ammonia ligase
MAAALILPPGYLSRLDLRQTEKGIQLIKDFFQTDLAAELRLTRATAPLFVLAGSGVNDDLNGVERPVSFPVRGLGEARAEVVQSLAKWKRLALADYGFGPGFGLYTDMNALRPDEELDNLHSVYVDQWDWERVILPADRQPGFLHAIVRRIWTVIKRLEFHVHDHHPGLVPFLPEEITILHSAELAERHPGLCPREREAAAAREHGAVFIQGIGAPLQDGRPHDGRAPDYDDWITETGPGRQGLNGDIVVWNPVLRVPFELSSMGIRVSPASLALQLEARGCPERARLDYHRRLLAGELPLTIGGGIGQSRLCMLCLRKAHIGEVQASLWPDDMRAACRAHGIGLL